MSATILGIISAFLQPVIKIAPDVEFDVGSAGYFVQSDPPVELPFLTGVETIDVYEGAVAALQCVGHEWDIGERAFEQLDVTECREVSSALAIDVSRECEHAVLAVVHQLCDSV